jgi:hypothetical protein
MWDLGSTDMEAMASAVGGSVRSSMTRSSDIGLI